MEISVTTDSFITINAFIHDFASAFWAVGIYLIWYFNRDLKEDYSKEVKQYLYSLIKKFIRFIIISIIVIIITGSIRTLLDFFILERTETYLIILIIKHILLISAAGISFIYIYNVKKKWKSLGKT